MRYGQCQWIMTTTLLLILGLALSVAFAQSEAADLAVQSRAQTAVIPVNSNLTLSAEVENRGPDDARFVSISAVLPPELVFLSSEGACTVADQSLTCAVGDLAVGETVVVHYQVRALAAGNGLSHAVSVSGAENDPDSDNNLANLILDVVIPAAVDLSLAGTIEPSQIDMGDLVTLSFTVDNPAAAPAYLTVIDLILPDSLVFETSDACVAEAARVRCRLGTVASMESLTVMLTVRAVAPGNPILLSGEITHAANDPNLSNNSVDLALIVNDPPPDSADLHLRLTPSATHWIVGEPQVMTLTLVNRGPAQTTAVLIEVELPETLVFVASEACQVVAAVVQCVLGDRPVDAAWTDTLTLIAIDTAPALTIVGRVMGQAFDPNPINNLATITAPARAAATPTAVIVTATTTVTPQVIPTATATLTPTALLLPTTNATQTPAIVVVTQPVFITALATTAGPGEADPGAGGRADGSGANPIPDGIAPSDLYGWRRHESVALIQVTGRWNLRTMANASDGAYHESRAAGALLRFPFEGDGFRVGYRSEVNGAAFQMVLDGDVVAVYDTHYATIASDLDPIRQTFVTQPQWVTPGYHVVDLICLTAGDGSAGCNIDYIEVFRGPPLPVAPTVMALPSTAVEIADVELVSAPPTRVPTVSPAPEALLSVAVLVSVDLNTNGQVDANEGVLGLTVRAVAVSNNSLLATAVTDAAGFARVRVASDDDVVLLIPVLGESFYLRNRGHHVDETWTLLLDPATVPGLIP